MYDAEMQEYEDKHAIMMWEPDQEEEDTGEGCFQLRLEHLIWVRQLFLTALAAGSSRICSLARDF